MYTRFLHSHPFITKSLTTGFLFSFSDALTQKFIEGKQTIQWQRNLALSLTGMTLIGPSMHVWYTYISPKFIQNFVNPKSSKFKKAIVGMLLNQISFTPCMLTVFYFMYGFYHQFSFQRGWRKGRQDCENKLKITLLNNWKLWPFVITISLLYIPLHYQVLFNNFVGIFWNAYLSYMVSHDV